MIIEKNLSNYLYKLYKNYSHNHSSNHIWVLSSLVWYCEGIENLKMITGWKDNLKGYCNCGDYRFVPIAKELKEKLKKSMSRIGIEGVVYGYNLCYTNYV